MATVDYRERYKIYWDEDIAFSKQYHADANRILLLELCTITDYENNSETPHPMDLKGYDRSIKVNFNFGIRIRNITHAHFADFTVDEKEWNHEITDPHYYYFYAYAYPPNEKHQIDFYMVLDYLKLKSLVREGLITYTIVQNRRHSSVKFYAFKIRDLAKHNLLIAYIGTSELLELFGLPKQANERIDRIMEVA